MATEAQSSSDPVSRALAFLGELSVDLEGAAIFDQDGALLGGTGENGQAWVEPARRLVAAAAGAEMGPVEQIHVATRDGEVFAVVQSGLTAVAVTDRFVLSSLITFDMRTVLRDLATQHFEAAAGDPATSAGKDEVDG